MNAGTEEVSNVTMAVVSCSYLVHYVSGMETLHLFQRLCSKREKGGGERRVRVPICIRVLIRVSSSAQ